MEPYYKWFGLLALTVYILYLLTRRRKRVPQPAPEDWQARLRLFLSGADRYPVSFDHCDFRDRSYAEEMPEQVSDLQLAAGIMAGGSAALLASRSELKETVQTLLYYRDPSLQEGKRLAQSFPLDATTLRYHVLEGRVSLYLHRGNPEHYLFLIEEPENAPA